MNKKAAARESVYKVPTNNDRNTNADGQQNGHTAIHPAFKLLDNVTIIPMKMRSKKTDIVIPPITAAHKRKPVGPLEIGHILTVLETREKLIQHCRLATDAQAILALSSIILMIIAEEIIFHLDPAEIRSNEPIASIVLKSVIAFLSFLQFILALTFWNFNFALVNVDNNQPQSWRLALSLTRILLILSELLIIIVLPYPCFNRYTLNSNETHGGNAYVAPDVAVSLPMFLRLYFVYRALVLHTQVMGNVGGRAVGYINSIHFSFPVITRIFLRKKPFTTFFALWILGFLVGSWSYRACEFHRDTGHLNYSVACWLYSVTFTTVGYGDVYPNTDGGRIVSAVVGLWGIISVAIVIAIIQGYLRMNDTEQYVFDYNTLLEINKERKYYIGNLIKFTVKTWYLRLNGNDKGHEYGQVRRKVYRAIAKLRNLRRRQLQEFAEDGDKDKDKDKANEEQMNPQIAEEIQNRLNQLDAKLDHLTQLMYHQMNINTQQNSFSILQRL